MSEKYISVVRGGPFNVILLDGEFSVLAIPFNDVPSISWWLLREYVYNIEDNFKNKYDSTFSSIIMDEDGLSVVCSPLEVSVIKSLVSKELNLSPKIWKALVINVVGSATEFPGAVYLLSNILSEENISILHISTFESEILLVQEQDIDKACNLLQSNPKLNELPSFLRKNKNSNNDLETNLKEELAEISIDNSEDNSLSKSSESQFSNGFVLNVLPSSVILARLSEDCKLSDCGEIIAKFLLYDKRYNNLAKILDDIRISSNSYSKDLSLALESSRKDKFLWGIWRCENEITLLLQENDVDRFPEGSLIVSPQPWKVIKLSGRPIEYDETGIVCAMSQIESDVPTLNISTALTNCTLVPEERLQYTLNQLSESLNCPVRN